MKILKNKLKNLRNFLILKIIKFFELDKLYFEEIILKKNFIEQSLTLARQSHPFEFFGYIKGKAENKKLILEEVWFAPQQSKRKSVKTTSLIFNEPENYIGTIHSHTIQNATPSSADLKVFSKSPINIIVTYPYIKNNIYVFDNRGLPKKFEIEK